MFLVLDRIFLIGLVLLIFATPLAIGSAPPRAYAAMEAAIFVLVIVWMLKLISQRSEFRRQTSDLNSQRSSLTSDLRLLISRATLPLVLFVGLILFQLMPLPPALLRVLSPSTFEFYSQIFFGWPQQAPYGDLAVAAVSGEPGAGSQDCMEQGAQSKEPDSKLSCSQPSGSGSVLLAPRSLLPQTWLPLTVAPYLTKIDLLKTLAYSALFLLVLCYPYGAAWEREQTETTPLGKRPPDERLLRGIVWAVLGSGFLVALIGFVQRFSWNGKILWFYEPYSTTPPAAGAVTRASGPFVNPDHFANYLALVLPLAVACALFGTALVSRQRQALLRLFGACTGSLIFTGVLLSLSRGALAAVAMSTAVLMALMPWGGATRGAKGLLRSGAAVARLSGIVFCALLIVGLYFAGPSGREQVADRLAGGVVDELSLGGRAQIWRDSPNLIADYPFFGVGLGAWPEVFMRYRSDPWGLNFFREAHNDYIQLLSEVGVVGFAFFAWFIASRSRRVLRGLTQVTTRYRPLIAAIVAAAAGMALHEWFDFNLRIPANAFLFIVLVALALRAVGSDALRARSRERGAGSGEPDKAPPEFVASTPFGLSGTGTARFSLVSFWQSLRPKTQNPISSPSGSVLPAPGSLQNSLSPLRFAGQRLMSALGALLRAPCLLLGNGSYLSAGSYHLLLAWALPGSKFAFAAAAGSGSVLQPRGALFSARYSARATPKLLQSFGPSRFIPYGVIVLSLFLIVQAVNQNPIPYPFNLGEAESLAEAKENVLIFPTNALYHETVLNFLGDPPPLSWQLRQLTAALWLEPANPYFRDRYAAALMSAGRNQEALREITRSVFNAPSFAVHPYLSNEALTKLPVDQLRAIEEGFRRALMSEFPGALQGLGDFLAGAGRFAEQASLFEKAASEEKDSAKKVDLALRAGAAYAKADNLAKAERLMSDAIVSNRADPRPYEYLIREVYGARKDMVGAKQIVAEALRHKAPALNLNLALAEAARKAEQTEEVASALAAAKAAVNEAAKDYYPFVMYLQLADGAARVGDHEHELSAMLAAFELQPADSEVLSRIANIYAARRNYDRAVIYLEKLAQIEFSSPEVYFRLARAEEARYRYAAAGRAYARALELDPDNKNYKSAYAAFKTNIEQNSAAKSREQGAGGVEQDSKPRSREQGARSQNRAGIVKR